MSRIMQFEPTLMRGADKLVAWWDAAQASIDSKDRFDRATWGTTTGGTFGTNTAPTFSSGGANGRAHAYSFNGTSSGRDRALPATVIGDDVPWCGLIGFKAANTSNENPLFSFAGGSTVPGVIEVGILSGSYFVSKRGETGGTATVTGGTPDTTNWHVMTVLHDGQNTDIWIDNTSVTSGLQAQNTVAVTAPTKLMIGVNSCQGVTPNHYFSGLIRALALYKTLLATADLKVLTKGLMNDLGI